jgi:hypothetical protein
MAAAMSAVPTTTSTARIAGSSYDDLDGYVDGEGQLPQDGRSSSTPRPWERSSFQGRVKGGDTLDQLRVAIDVEHPNEVAELRERPAEAMVALLVKLQNAVRWVFIRSQPGDVAV